MIQQQHQQQHQQQQQQKQKPYQQMSELERERDNRRKMMSAEEQSLPFYHMSKRPLKILPKEMMTGPVFKAVSVSPTYDHFKKTGISGTELRKTYNSLPLEIKQQYENPSPSEKKLTLEEIFYILKNQRKGTIKRRPYFRS